MRKREFCLKNIDVTHDELGLCISWQAQDPGCEVDIFVGEHPTRMELQRPALTVQGEGPARLNHLDTAKRCYFLLRPRGFSYGVFTAQRRVPLSGAINFRDLGGYETSDGRRVKWGQIFRSDALSRLTATDQALFRHLDIRQVFDFRTPAEVESAPDLLPEDHRVSYSHLPVIHGEFDPAVALARIRQGDISWLTEDFMRQGYIKNIEQYPHVWSSVIRAMANENSAPLVFHCTGGKDRAGACAALTLLALGVPRETVIQDHGLSNVYIGERLPHIKAFLNSHGVDPDKALPYFTAPRASIESLIDHLEEKYGGAVNYLAIRGELPLSIIEKLKKQLLE